MNRSTGPQPQTTNPEGPQSAAQEACAEILDIVGSYVNHVVRHGLPGSPEQLLAALGSDLADVFSRKFGSPEEAFDAMNASRGVELGEERDETAFGATLASGGVDPSEFAEAFGAALEDGLGPNAVIGGELGPLAAELFAMGAAGAHLVPGGAAAFDAYIARHQAEPPVRRWGARVRSLARQGRFWSYRTERRWTRITGRAPRRQAPRRRRTLSRDGPRDAPVPREPPPRRALRRERHAPGGVS